MNDSVRVTVSPHPKMPGRFAMTLLMRGHEFIPSAAYFLSAEEAVFYAILGRRMPLEIYGQRVQDRSGYVLRALVRAIMKQDGSITAEGRPIEVIIQKPDAPSPSFPDHQPGACP